MAFSLICGKAPWGDYGDALVHGFGSRKAPVAERARRDRTGIPSYDLPLLLERTGPFVPPIFQPLPEPGCLVVTSSARDTLQWNWGNELRFKPAELKHVAWSDWHTWDLLAPRPRRRPFGGEPENYIMGRPYSKEAAAAMGELWELLPPQDGLFEVHKVEDGQRDIWVCEDSWKSSDLFTLSEAVTGHIA